MSVSPKGKFSLTSISRQQVNILREKYHVYMLPSGRISVTGCKSAFGRLFVCRILTMPVTEFNVKYVAESFNSVIRETASF